MTASQRPTERRDWRATGATVRSLTGPGVHAAIPDVATLRIAVFRDFPYLYDGDAAYEREYLAAFAASPRAVVVVALDGERVVGAATGAPLADVEDDWSRPFRDAGMAVARRFYCAESVLLPAWRGMGLGHAFFDAREEHARGLGMTESCFCSVMRPGDHPARPATYRSHETFWRKRGYAPLPGIRARFAWRDVGEGAETVKDLQFWGRSLSA